MSNLQNKVIITAALTGAVTPAGYHIPETPEQIAEDAISVLESRCRDCTSAYERRTGSWHHGRREIPKNDRTDSCT